MYKSEDSVFVNEYGHEEIYTRKTLESYKSGHVNLGSAFCSYSDCGNCDGGRCDSCCDMYAIHLYDIPVYNPEFGCEELKRLWVKIVSDKEEALDIYNKA